MSIGVVSPIHQKTSPPRFQGGLIKPGLTLKTFDYVNLSTTPMAMSMLIYTWIILTRILFSRSDSERRENLRRDPLGWYAWFMGTPLMQGLLIRGLPKDIKPLIFTEKTKHLSLPHKIFNWIVQPTANYHVTSDKQLKQRAEQLIKLATSDTMKKAIEKRFAMATKVRALVYFFSLMFTFATLGIGIQWINIMLTKRDVMKRMNLKKEPDPIDALQLAMPLSNYAFSQNNRGYSANNLYFDGKQMRLPQPNFTYRA